eukprot:6190980-Pleurochrysis_carterae.AAC.1
MLPLRSNARRESRIARRPPSSSPLRPCHPGPKTPQGGWWVRRTFRLPAARWRRHRARASRA